MSDQWHIIEPAEATNLIENPGAEVNKDDFWGEIDNGAGAVFARDAATTYYGIGSFKITAGNGTAYYVSSVFSLGDDETVYAQCVGRTSTISSKHRLIIYDATTPAVRATLTGTTADTWEELSGSWKNETGGAVNVQLLLYNLAADSGTPCLFDAVAAFIDVDSTYVDGDQPGCVWNGEAHNSTSTRSALSQDGGVEYDLGTDLAFWVDTEIGLSSAPVSNTFLPYAMTDGDLYNGSKRQGRPFTLGGIVVGTSKTDLHDNMHDVLDIFKVSTEDEVRISYDGGTSEKWFMARYEAGLQGRYTADLPTTQRLTLRMYSADPNMYQVNDTNDVLDVNDTATLRYVAGRLRSTGQWSDLGLTANPTADGTIYAIFAASDKSIYLGGDYDGIDNNSPVGGDYIIRYDPYAGTFNLLVGASDLNGAVLCITEGPDGKIYLGGVFTAVNGVGTADYVVAYDPSADTWSSLGDPHSGAANITSVRAFAWDSDGNLYVGGLFLNFADEADADYIAKWDGTSWSAVGSGGTDTVDTIAIDSDDNIYIGGAFLNWSADANADYWALWNGSAWAAVNDIALNGAVTTMLFDAQDDLYVGGAFTDASSVANADYIFIWTGTQILALGAPPNDRVRELSLAPNDNLWIAGDFTTAGGTQTADRIAVWNGSTWTIPDINLPGSPNIRAIYTTNPDPQTNDNYDVYIGWDVTGAGYFAGAATVNNPGNKDAYPTFVLSRSGGTSAKLLSIRNETTGKQLYFDHGLLDGETVEIRMASRYAEVTSTFWGVQRFTILPSSDSSEFVLIPGDNIITAFVDIAGAPTMTANCLHKAVFTGYDD